MTANPTLNIKLDGVVVHLAASANKLPPGVRYRIAVPQSTSRNQYHHANLGGLAPSVFINGRLVTGPAVITISGSNPGSPTLPDRFDAPSLSTLVPTHSFSPDPSIAYPAFPTTKTIFLDINIAGSFGVPDGEKLLWFTASDAEGLSMTVRTAKATRSFPIKARSLPILADNTIAIVNRPQNATIAGVDTTLLGFLGLASLVPGDARPPAASFASGVTEAWTNPADPGCSNSQWP